MFKYLFALLCLSLCACQTPSPTPPSNPQSWEQTLAAARGQSLTMMMWQGDPLINQYLKTEILPQLKTEYDIELRLVPGQGSQLVSAIMTELEAGKNPSEIDLVWINGETFFQLRQIKALHGPFVEQLPNNQYLDWANPFIAKDFQQEVGGYECPWGNVQFTLIYNTTQITQPPQDLEQLASWLQANPGKFTWGNDFTGMTLLKSWLIHFAGGPTALNGPFDEAKYRESSAKLWTYVRRIRPFLWNQGRSFPSSLAQMHQLFANGELWFTMSNNDAEVDNKILQGVFPPNSRAYVMNIGSIQNSHYLGIVAHSSKKAAAMVVCNLLISPQAQWKKAQPSIWGDGSVLAPQKLPQEWQARFAQLPGRKQAPPRDSLQAKALQEPAAEYMLRLFEDFRTQILDQ